MKDIGAEKREYWSGINGKRFGDNLEGLLRKPFSSLGVSTDDNDGKRQIRINNPSNHAEQPTYPLVTERVSLTVTQCERATTGKQCTAR
jgi:hypothetical protein